MNNSNNRPPPQYNGQQSYNNNNNNNGQQSYNNNNNNNNGQQNYNNNNNNQQGYNNNNNNQQWGQNNRPSGPNGNPFQNRPSHPQCEYCGKTNHAKTNCFKRPDRIVHRVNRPAVEEATAESKQPSTSTAPQQTTQKTPTVAVNQQIPDNEDQKPTTETDTISKQNDYDNHGWQVWAARDNNSVGMVSFGDDEDCEVELYVSANDVCGTTMKRPTTIPSKKQKASVSAVTKRPSRLYIDIMINNVIVRGLLDTGAQITLMRRSMYNKHFTKSHPISNEGKNCYGFDGVQSSPIDGTFDCEVEIAGKTFPLKVHVVPTLDVDAIFSNHMIHDFKMDIFASKHEICIGDKKIQAFVHTREETAATKFSANAIEMVNDPPTTDPKSPNNEEEPDSTTEISINSEPDPDQTLSDNEKTITPEPETQHPRSSTPATTINKPETSIFGIPDSDVYERMRHRKSYKRKLPHRLCQEDHNEESLIKRLCNWRIDGPCTSHGNELTTINEGTETTTKAYGEINDVPELMDTPIMTTPDQQMFNAYANVFNERDKSVGMTSKSRLFRLPDGDEGIVTDGLTADRWNIPEATGDNDLISSKKGYKKLGNNDELVVTQKTTTDTRYCIKLRPGDCEIPDEYGINFNNAIYRCTYGTSAGVPIFHRDYDVPRTCPRHWTMQQFNSKHGQSSSKQ
jgi:hypothetical protein